jgi:hypothetical protein
MHIEVLVEEASAEAALRNILPMILAPNTTFRVHPFQGKPDLLKSLPNRLQGYARWIPENMRILVLVDEDRQECQILKAKLETMAQQAGLVTKSRPVTGGRFSVINRIAIEELEAWFFGDITALRAAYPRVPANLDRRAAYRIPDAISGGTAEALERVLKKAGYYAGGLPKIEAARKISQHMDPGRNTSGSFQMFRDALRALHTEPDGA